MLKCTLTHLGGLDNCANMYQCKAVSMAYVSKLQEKKPFVNELMCRFHKEKVNAGSGKSSPWKCYKMPHVNSIKSKTPKKNSKKSDKKEMMETTEKPAVNKKNLKAGGQKKVFQEGEGESTMVHQTKSSDQNKTGLLIGISVAIACLAIVVMILGLRFTKYGSNLILSDEIDEGSEEDRENVHAVKKAQVTVL
eukprot:m.46680 g.46680  ORF g.46680 m.46680 type:complete len:193 (+) comp10395_c0_seq3:1274-1852(+)